MSVVAQPGRCQKARAKERATKPSVTLVSRVTLRIEAGSLPSPDHGAAGTCGASFSTWTYARRASGFSVGGES